MLRKVGLGAPEIWAVDWVATGVRRFLPEFSDAIITEDDLALAGEWISLLQKDAGGKLALWLVNYRSGEKRQLGLFRDAPLRAWSKSGNRFAYWFPENGLCIYNITDATQQPVICAGTPVIDQMKWSPRDTRLAIVANEPAMSSKKQYLALLDPATCNTTRLVENFSANEQQWDWYSETMIVYTEGGELWQVDMVANRTLLASTASL